MLGVPICDLLSCKPEDSVAWRSASDMPLPVMLNRLENLLRVLVPVLLRASYALFFSGAAAFAGCLILVASSRACKGICLDENAFDCFF